jgi:hypothetical protein
MSMVYVHSVKWIVYEYGVRAVYSAQCIMRVQCTVYSICVCCTRGSYCAAADQFVHLKSPIVLYCTALTAIEAVNSPRGSWAATTNCTRGQKLPTLSFTSSSVSLFPKQPLGLAYMYTDRSTAEYEYSVQCRASIQIEAPLSMSAVYSVQYTRDSYLAYRSKHR